MESTSLWRLWTGISAQDDLTTFRTSSAFLGFTLETAFLMSPHKFSIGVRSGGFHDVNVVGLEPRCCSLTGVFVVGVLVKHTFPEHFLSSIRQHDLFRYCDICKLIHDPWYVRNRPNTTVWQTAPHHDACTTMFQGLQSGLWLNSVFGGGHLTHRLQPLDPKSTLLLLSVHKIFLRFPLGQLMCSD